MRNDPATRAVIQDLRGAFIPNEAFNALKDLFETLLDQRRADLAAGRLTNVRSIALVGGSGSGKSTLIRHLHESRSDLVIAEGEDPCEFASQLVPSPATMKFVGTAILHALGYPLARDKSAPVIWGMVADQLQRRKTLFLHLDEAQDLARFQTDRERQSVVNTLKSMMENRTWPVSLILSGTPELKKIINQDPQLARRIYPVAIPRLTVPRHVNAVVELTRRYAERGTLTMRHVVRNFLTENYPIRSGTKILGEEIHKGRRMTFADARQASGIARARMATTLGHLRPVSQKATAAVTDVSVEDIQTVHEFWSSHSNLKDAAERLGLHPAQMKAFIETGVLEAIRLNSALRYVTNASIGSVLALVSSAPVDRANSELLPIADFSQSRCISIARLVKNVLDGKIKDVRRNPELTGIRSLLIDNGQLPIRQRRRHRVDMSVTEAAEHLQIGAMGVRALRDSGYLVQVHRRNPDTNHQRAFITIESISRFEAECETLGQMATRMGVRPMHLAKQLDNAGVDPVATTGRMVRAYLRVALAR